MVKVTPSRRREVSINNYRYRKGPGKLLEELFCKDNRYEESSSDERRLFEVIWVLRFKVGHDFKVKSFP